ncbi:hypothetical protein GO988_11385 [Hymenobacter sp. HMF4947]|uniref:Uncharacterized protein n=1 Tax=Hymenobacter ginkgonis TaxID=2682976 RepID=A0A7K1TEU0_9BACT|nr:hypothetical protein [Hymenobacter ginkgonis]MVN76927.1 hypothetical protein [Hymenobacter ginkgonis]
MKNTPIFAIPVRSHVRQFLLHEFGAEQPWAIHQNTFMGRVVRMKLEKHPFRQLRRSEPCEGPSVHLTLPTALRHYTLTPDSAKQIGEMLDKLFQQQLVMWVKAQVAATGNERAALRSFCKLYDIDPSEADLEMLRKIYRDYKDKVLRENGHYQLLYGTGGREELFSDFAVAS